MLSSGAYVDSIRRSFRAAVETDLVIIEPTEWVPHVDHDNYAEALLEMCYYRRSLYSNAGEATEEFSIAHEQRRRAHGAALRKILLGNCQGNPFHLDMMV